MLTISMLNTNRCHILDACGSCTHGDVKLVDGSVPSEGRVEMCVDGRWRTMRGWREPNTAVVCFNIIIIKICIYDMSQDKSLIVFKRF